MMSKYAFLQPYKADKIRVGNKGDGAYILEEKSIQNVEAVLSYGCGWDTSFEESFCSIKKAPIFIFDPTLMDKSMLDTYRKKYGKGQGDFRYATKVFVFNVKLFKHWLLGRKIHFVNEGIAATNSDKYKTLGHHVQKYRLADKNILLKIDVEGAEFEVWLTEEFKNLLKNVLQLTIEIHDLKSNFDQITQFYGMMEKHFLPIHVHGNNYAGTYKEGDFNIPNVIEVTWVRKNLVKQQEIDNGSFPSPDLDMPNDLALKDIELHPLWS